MKFQLCKINKNIEIMIPVEMILSPCNCSVEFTYPDHLGAGDGTLMIQ